MSCLVLRGGKVYWTLSLYYDLFFSSVGLLCGGILIFQGWRLDPILLLCQILSCGTAIFFIGESLWLRSINSKKNKIWNNKQKENHQRNQILNKFTRETKNISIIPIEHTYQEVKLVIPYKTNPSWETIHYTGPIDY